MCTHIDFMQYCTIEANFCFSCCHCSGGAKYCFSKNYQNFIFFSWNKIVSGLVSLVAASRLWLTRPLGALRVSSVQQARVRPLLWTLYIFTGPTDEGMMVTSLREHQEKTGLCWLETCLHTKVSTLSIQWCPWDLPADWGGQSWFLTKKELEVYHFFAN